MPRYRYTGEDERIYCGPPTLQVAPGDTVDADTNPDPTRFELAEAPAKPSPRPRSDTTKES